MNVSQEIIRTLDTIEKERGVRILYACEAGSRAWGFPSPDSDWDVRFIYAHPADWYTTFDVEHRRDVIEWKTGFVTDDGKAIQPLDVSGWDVRKALYLFTRSNGALLEWLGSPIEYRNSAPSGSTTFSDRLLEMANNVTNLTALCYHYSHMARRNAREYLYDQNEVRLKKYLYVIRPLLAIQYIENFRAVPPVLFDKLLLSTVHPSQDLAHGIAYLLRLKKETPELGLGKPIPVLNEFIDAELARHNDAFKGQGRPELKHDLLRAELNKLFQQAIGYTPKESGE